MKFYAVKQGRQPGVYGSWKECQEQTAGYSGAVFKSFETEAEALAYFQAVEAQQPINSSLPAVYIDGSCKHDGSLYGYGGFIENGSRITILQGTGSNPDYLPERNIAGELNGALKAIEECASQGIKEINLFFDYAGIENYVNGSWKPATKLAKQYNYLFPLLETDVQVHFCKVAGHTGIAGNEIADYLAKEAVGAKLRKKDVAALAAFRSKATNCA